MGTNLYSRLIAFALAMCLMAESALTDFRFTIYDIRFPSNVQQSKISFMEQALASVEVAAYRPPLGVAAAAAAAGISRGASGKGGSLPPAGQIHQEAEFENRNVDPLGI